MSFTIDRDLRRKLEKSSRLPSVPQVVYKIQQISSDPKASVVDLANCILSDHQLTTRILRMANSTYYGDYAGRVNTVTHAIVLMGFRTIRNIAVTMSVYGLVNKLSAESRFDIVSFWTRSLGTGLIARYLARRTEHRKLAEAAFIAGFLHDIGQVMLAAVMPEQYCKISKQETESQEVYKTEMALMGIDHLEVGGYIAHTWNLPPGLVNAIADHHRVGLAPTTKSDEVLADLVYLGDVLYAHMMNQTPVDSKQYVAVVDLAHELVGVSRDDMMELMTDIREQISEVASDFEIDVEKEFEKRAVVGADDLDIHQQLAGKDVQLAFLQNSTIALTEARSDEEVLQIVCETVFRGLSMGRVLLFEHDTTAQVFVGKLGYGLDSQDEVRRMTFSAKVGLFKQICQTGEAISVVGDNREIYGALISREDQETLEAEAFVAMPIKILSATKFVLFADRTQRSDPIKAEMMRSIMSLATQAGLVLERNMLRDRVGQA